MDLELTFWQMLYMCLSPSLVCVRPHALHAVCPDARGCRYRHTTYHKRASRCLQTRVVALLSNASTETKNQWARDDPAFVVLTCGLVAVAATAYCATFGASLGHALLTILSAVCLDYLLLGAVLATCGWRA